MKAEEASLKKIIESEPHRLEIPFFQRRYVWKEENWEEMLHAVEKSRTEKVFWGSVIIKITNEYGNVDGFQYGKGYIIDGQQRLTTIAILTKAIYDSLSINAQKGWAKEKISNDIFFKPFSSAEQEQWQLIIEHSRVDKEAFEYVVRTGVFDDDVVEVEENEESQIKRCYSYYKKCLETRSEKELATLMDYLYSDEKVFVLITLDEQDINEQAIFDSINRAGQKLYTSDIVKNNLFKEFMYITHDKEYTCELCDKYWDAIFWTSNFWDETRNFGNMKKSHLDFLLYCIACITWSDEPLQNINDNLEMVYEKRTQGYEKQELEDFIVSIAKYALIYKEYIYDFGEQIEEYTFSNGEDVKRLLLIMDKFKIQMFYPYIMKRLYENVESFDICAKKIVCNMDDERLKKDARILETYIVRRRIYSANTSIYSKKCMEILRKGVKSIFSESLSEDANESIEAENKLIGESLKGINKDVAKMLLFCLELTRWGEKDDLGALNYNYQLEHIMPMHWKQHWPLPSSIAEDTRDAAVKEIGNMILLSQALNKHIKNREFAVKMEGEVSENGKNKKEGYKDRTQLKLTKEIVDNYFQNGDRVWDEKHISDRTEKIKREICEHWSIEKVLEDS